MDTNRQFKHEIEEAPIVPNLVICVIINWLTIIYMFACSLYLSEKTQNGKNYVCG